MTWDTRLLAITGKRFSIWSHPGGFHHNVQSLRVVDVLESTSSRRGMNLTAEVRDGIVNHTVPGATVHIGRTGSQDK